MRSTQTASSSSCPKTRPSGRAPTSICCVRRSASAWTRPAGWSAACARAARGARPVTDDAEPELEERTKPSGLRNVAEWVVIAGGALLVAFVIKTFLLQAFYIPSLSMAPTLKVNDRVLVNKLSYDLHDVHRGDLVVFDGHGYAHPRRCGLASHLSIELDVPGVGVAKSRLIGTYKEPAPEAGDRADDVAAQRVRVRAGDLEQSDERCSESEQTELHW